MTKTEESVARKLERLHPRLYERLLLIAKRLRAAARWLDPEDLVQEALLRLLELPETKVERMPGGELDNWLIHVLNNRFIDLYRKRMSHQKAKDDPAITRWTISQEESPLAFEGMTDERFALALKKIPLKQRLVVLLHCEELTHEEIARRLGISKGLVAKRLTDARKSLKKLLVPKVDEGVH